MNGRDLVESIRIPFIFVVTMWVITFLIMVGIEAIKYVDDQVLAITAGNLIR